MKIQLKNNTYNNFNDREDKNLLEKYLLSLGIEEDSLSSFLVAPKEEDKDNYLNLLNIENAVAAAKNILDKDGGNNSKIKIFIQVDSDTDGWTSSAILIQYLQKRYGEKIDIVYKLHPGKEHGINLTVIPEDVQLVFIPDAGSNDFNEQNKLTSEGKTVIILDHHHITNTKALEETKAIIVNNQISKNFTNKSLSGAGVTYMFIQALENTYNNKVITPKDFMDLAAVGVIADAMDMSTLGNNYLSEVGLCGTQNIFLKTLAIHQSRGIKNPDFLTKMDVSFYIAPVINGVIRSGTPEDKEITFKALCTPDSEEVFTTEWRGKIRNENLYEYAVRIATNAKSRQDNAKKKGFELICKKIREKGMDKTDSLIIVNLTAEEEKKVPNNTTGLVAMELVKEFNRPCLLLRKTMFNDVEVCGGSGRNGNYYFLPSLLKFLHESGLVEYAEGHDGAFGVFIKEENIEKLVKYANEKIPLSNFDDDIYEVDGWFQQSEVDNNMDILLQFAEKERLWGIGIPKPTFAFTVDVHDSDIKLMGADMSSVKIRNNFVSFKNEELTNKLNQFLSRDLKNAGNFLRITMTGSPSVNEWMGRKTVQVIMNYYEIEEISPISTFDSLI